MKAWHGWAALAGGIAVWDITVADEHMLSSGYDRFRHQHPILAWFVVLTIANHLLRVSKLDALRLFELAAKGNR